MEAQTKEIWNIDAGHSAVQFSVKHMAIAYVNGTFDRFKGTICNSTGQDDFHGAEINFKIEAVSLNTNNQKRDEDLRSELFFDVQQFPALGFKGILQKESNTYELVGNLNIRDKTKEVRLNVCFYGMGKGRFGDTRAGFELNGKINRKDFGLTWNLFTEAGGLIIGEDIKLHMDVELIKE